MDETTTVAILAVAAVALFLIYEQQQQQAAVQNALLLKIANTPPAGAASSPFGILTPLIGSLISAASPLASLGLSSSGQPLATAPGSPVVPPPPQPSLLSRTLSFDKSVVSGVYNFDKRVITGIGSGISSVGHAIASIF